MNRIGCKRRDADGEIFGAVRCAVLNPFASMGNDRLAGSNIDHFRSCPNSKHSAQNQRIFVKLRALPRFRPARRASHPCDAYAVGF